MKLSKMHLKVSLRTKIIAMVFGMISVLCGMSIIQMQDVARKEELKSLKNFQGYAKLFARSISSQFFERYNDTKKLAKNPAFLSTNEEEMIDALNGFITHSASYDLALIVNANGDYIASNNRSRDGKALDTSKLKGVNFAKKAWFQDTIEGRFTENAPHNITGVVFGDAAIDEISGLVYGDGRYGTSFTTRIQDKSGKIVAILTTRADFSWVESEVEHINNIFVANGWRSTEMAIINKKGDLILDHDPDETKNDTAVKRDFNVLLKLNLAENGVGAAKELVEGRSGFTFATHVRKKVEQAAAYELIDDNKFVRGIGWGVLIRDIREDLLANIDTMRRTFFIATALFLILFFAISWFLTQILSRTFIEVSEHLKDAADSMNSTAKDLESASQIVSDAGAEQASAVQETVSSMSEISSMIGQTVQNVRECNSLAERVGEKTENGNQIMQRLASTMSSVQSANDQLQHIANIISEVSAKTMVINDIVFKTQLLSINASIEAARAGQHGKGFSVVAEEVGNLAQMSGLAAKEVQALIHDSQKQVAEIIASTQSRVKDGQNVSAEALEAFGEIARDIRGMNDRIQSIVNAAKEQEAGVQQVSTAMDQIDASTQQNSAASRNANKLAKELATQSARIDRIMLAIRTLVLGSLRANKKNLEGKSDLIADIVGENRSSIKGNQSFQGTSDHQEMTDVKQAAANLLKRGINALPQDERLAAGGSHGEQANAMADVTSDDPSFEKAA